jgi:hypothetical protein
VEFFRNYACLRYRRHPEAAEVGIGPEGAKTFADGLARKKLFNLLPKSLTGSSAFQQAFDAVSPGVDLATGVIHLATARLC